MTGGALGGAEGVGRVTTTVFIGRNFEVRDHDQPVKSVFNGDARVARVTGSLSPADRVQRIRLRSGWNLVSLAVTAEDVMGQLSRGSGGEEGPLGDAGMSVYQWQPAAGEYLSVAGGATVEAGTVLWVRSSFDRVVSVRGEYRELGARAVAAGGGYVAGPGVEVWPLEGWAQVMVWKHDAAVGRWRAGLGDGLSSASDLPAVLGSGEAIYVHTDEPVELAVPDADLRVRYHHADHLGSAAVITDGRGELVEETAFHPFGEVRHEHRPRVVDEPFKFTGKERDAESGLMYFGARYLVGRLARFPTVDPLASDLPADWLRTPQKLNPYAYVANNPLTYVDPVGLDAKKAAEGEGGRRVLVMYGESQFQDFAKVTGNRDRRVFERALSASYGAEAGKGGQIVVERLNLKSGDDVKAIFKGKSYDVVVYTGHGMENRRELAPGSGVKITPEHLAEAFKGAEKAPEAVYFYGCNTAKNGFARQVSELMPGTAVTGASTKIAPDYAWDAGPRGSRSNLRITEDRSYNITYKGGEETADARKVDIRNATLPR
jgi:RHS repeat-associated protein